MHLVHDTPEAALNRAWRVGLLRSTIAGLLAVIALAGCGSSNDGTLGRGALRWTQTPFVDEPPTLPRDRILVGHVVNRSRRTLALDTRKLVVHDATGRTLVSSARFTIGYAHALYGVFQQPSFNAPSELIRLGVITYIRPGVTAPLFVAYRLKSESKLPITVDYGYGRLPLPSRPSPRRSTQS
jgi:hypothetical protein